MTQILTQDFARHRIRVHGIVQGVGFRPFVYNLAIKNGLTGFVTNNSHGVEIQIEGDSHSVTAFMQQLEAEPPPLAIITKLTVDHLNLNHDQSFEIISSHRESNITTLISPDVAVCRDCLTELFNPTDRRFQYPFINCTNCGPRYTIIESIPYDRPFTSMRNFKMCPDCQAEYDNPSDRRFHAQPNACPECGPHIWLIDRNGNSMTGGSEITTVVDNLRAGMIVAIKGLGGFHLAVNASDTNAVDRLRKRKNREAKPLAVMFPNLEKTRQYVTINPDEAELLVSYQSPIVLCKKSGPRHVNELVAPGNNRLGVILPYTPLHHLILHEFDGPLVMTSANLSDEPICIENDEALHRLANIADLFLLHNRDIYLRSDDSVFVHINGKNRPVRRSRGFVPRPIFLSGSGPSVLAVGGDLKNTVCLTAQERAFMSQHIGDMENLESSQFFQRTIDHLERVLEIEPELIVHDLHPGYFTTQWAQKQHLQTLGVQHHHAHLAACMTEHGLDEPVIGIIADGTGYGTDGTIWGGEILMGDYTRFERFGHLENMLLPGGDAAIKAPWRTATAYLYQAFNGKNIPVDLIEKWNYQLIFEMLETKTNTAQTSSTGRLFDAVAALCGICPEIRYEGQAAIELMQACTTTDVPPFTFGIKSEGPAKILCVRPLMRDIALALMEGAGSIEISNRFHRTLIEWFLKSAKLARQASGINTVVLSGGVFQNEVILAGLIPVLERNKFCVYSHIQVPTNDGGLSLGQAMIGRKYLETLKEEG
ncbi:MAG: carbamoyltransferase HypF [Candidatus Marinimicrobia bacterium]|nr:carbamoyltransferase HypF [Candidatus Neomarinimicrobiota bacterium]